LLGRSDKVGSVECYGFPLGAFHCDAFYSFHIFNVSEKLILARDFFIFFRCVFFPIWKTI
jgi:hypothetical protein